MTRLHPLLHHNLTQDCIIASVELPDEFQKNPCLGSQGKYASTEVNVSKLLAQFVPLDPEYAFSRCINHPYLFHDNLIYAVAAQPKPMKPSPSQPNCSSEDCCSPSANAALQLQSLSSSWYHQLAIIMQTLVLSHILTLH